MKGLFNKIIQAITALLVSWIIVYGACYTQPTCGLSNPDTCIPSLDRTTTDTADFLRCTACPGYIVTPLKKPTAYLGGSPTESGVGNDCCELNPCNDNNHTVFIYSPLTNPLSSIRKGTPSQPIDSGLQYASAIEYRFEPITNSPIYIQKQAILC